MKDGFLKIACVTPPLRVADCTYNADQIIAKAKEAAQAGAKLAAFPELCLTGYTCGDLFLQGGPAPGRRGRTGSHSERNG